MTWQATKRRRGWSKPKKSRQESAARIQDPPSVTQGAADYRTFPDDTTGSGETGEKRGDWASNREAERVKQAEGVQARVRSKNPRSAISHPRRLCRAFPPLATQRVAPLP